MVALAKEFTARPRPCRAGNAYPLGLRVISGQRYLHTDLGRWCSTDPEEVPANLYVALGNNPPNGVDAIGLWVTLDFAVRGAGLRWTQSGRFASRAALRAQVLARIGSAGGVRGMSLAQVFVRSFNPVQTATSMIYSYIGARLINSIDMMAQKYKIQQWCSSHAPSASVIRGRTDTATAAADASLWAALRSAIPGSAPVTITRFELKAQLQFRIDCASRRYMYFIQPYSDVKGSSSTSSDSISLASRDYDITRRTTPLYFHESDGAASRAVLCTCCLTRP